jgi:amidophosphoribosyltransferase
MSDPIKHECGIAIVRLKKPLAHYRQAYGSSLWGLRKLYLLMEKQRNRGQDGAGMAVLRQGMPAGAAYINRLREGGQNCLDRLWKRIHDEHARAVKGIAPEDVQAVKNASPYIGEAYLGHLRYGTHGGYGIENCHPFMRFSNWPTRQLCVAGNFNLTNTDEIFRMLVELGQHPVGNADTATVMEKIGHFLDVANEAILRRLEDQGLSGEVLTAETADQLDLAKVLKRACRAFDGGYFMAGMVGHGAVFALRDPNGIRPAYWYEDEDVVAAASERAALVTCFDVEPERVAEVKPGHALIVDHQARVSQVEILPAGERKSCTFERIYFSRGNDADIYRERKALGRELVEPMLDAIDHDIAHTIISYVPNTAESAYYGLAEGLEAWLAEWKERQILALQAQGQLTQAQLHEILSVRPWQEKATQKDAKLRTFITGEDDRGELVGHAYDVTRGILRPGIDNLVAIDDSIVRGTTMRNSLLRMLSRLKPKRLVILSSAPQIRYPDCYGIDMSELGKFVAFEAAISLLRERGMQAVIDDVYAACKVDSSRPPAKPVNHVQRIYAPFADAEISARVADLVRPAGWDGDLRVVYQSVAGLRQAIPGHTGDWYFTGDYPTPGGTRVCVRAFVNYIEKRTGRAYEGAAS